MTRLERLSEWVNPESVDEWPGPWWSGWMECRICGHRHIAVVPVEHEDDDLLTRCECHECGHMAAEAIEEA